MSLKPANLPNQNHVAVSCNVGHNGTHVCCQFSRPIPDMMLTPEQAEAHITALQLALQALRDGVTDANKPS